MLRVDSFRRHSSSRGRKQVRAEFLRSNRLALSGQQERRAQRIVSHQQSDDPSLERDVDCTGATVRVQFGQDTLKVCSHRVLGESIYAALAKHELSACVAT